MDDQIFATGRPAASHYEKLKRKVEMATKDKSPLERKAERVAAELKERERRRALVLKEINRLSKNDLPAPPDLVAIEDKHTKMIADLSLRHSQIMKKAKEEKGTAMVRAAKAPAKKKATRPRRKS